jgi:hypothetical protein
VRENISHNNDENSVEGTGLRAMMRIVIFSGFNCSVSPVPEHMEIIHLRNSFYTVVSQESQTRARSGSLTSTNRYCFSVSCSFPSRNLSTTYGGKQLMTETPKKSVIPKRLDSSCNGSSRYSRMPIKKRKALRIMTFPHTYHVLASSQLRLDVSQHLK